MKSSLNVGATTTALFLLALTSSSRRSTATTTTTTTTTTTAEAFVLPTSSSSSSSAIARRPVARRSSSGVVVVAAARRRPSQFQEDPTFSPPDVVVDGGISEVACAEAASRMRRVMVPVSRDVSGSGYVGISYILWEAADRKEAYSGSGGPEEGGDVLPLLLVHGFDSSSLEYRRLGPALSSLGVDVYCVDLLGWGYTKLDDSVRSYSARAKVEALRGFWDVVGGNGDVVVGGASLGGAAVIEFAADVLGRGGGGNDGGDGNNFVRGTVLLDAQGFVDGIGPMSYLPPPLARLGIRVLKSVPLRNAANKMSYHDPETYATDDALRVGRLHCLREGWEDGMLSFMKSGGFRPREKVPTINVPTLVLWGRQDGILDGVEYANAFVDAMPDATLRWIEECGHVPHLEQPETTARYISEFLRSEKVRPNRPTPSTMASPGDLLEGLFRFLK